MYKLEKIKYNDMTGLVFQTPKFGYNENVCTNILDGMYINFLMNFSQEVLSMIRKKGFSMACVSNSKRENNVDFGT